LADCLAEVLGDPALSIGGNRLEVAHEGKSARRDCRRDCQDRIQQRRVRVGRDTFFAQLRSRPDAAVP
jgi:hypothetical protein